MVDVQDRMFTPQEARWVVSWAYEPPFDFYDLSGEGAVALFQARDEFGHGYYPLQEGPDVVGFVCFGAEARVRGQVAVPGTCDIGAGLRPDRLSQGLATRLLPKVVAFAAERFTPQRLRVGVAAFNERSLRLCTSAGFRRMREFDGPGDQTFVELVLDVDR